MMIFERLERFAADYPATWRAVGRGLLALGGLVAVLLR